METPMVHVEVTPPAIEQVRKILARDAKPDQALRLFVQGGGCSGLTYGMTFDRSESGDEIAFEQDGLKVVVDHASAPLLDGLKVDYLLGLEASGFKIINPNAKSTCSCGKSFSA
ncbi:MAG: iron-sulfur cluster assembly accessory protein [Thermoplasmata archaeon]|nr:iron-sulfur cluster assembly accessory protein [Thermoplasmata archaeon]